MKRYRANESELNCRHRTCGDVETHRSNAANKTHVEAIIGKHTGKLKRWMFAQTNLTTKYIFRNVTKLTLMIDQEWPIDSVEHLSTIVNLSTLQK
ncbi:unnamed protein product, partial [Rotaria sp. Silwood1]